MSELNEKIMDTLTKNDCYVHDSDGAIFFEETKLAANEIEKLVLQEKIDLLENIKHGLIQKQIINNNIDQLKEQLNLIK